MAGMRRVDEQTTTQEPHGGLQGEGGLGGSQGRKDAYAVGAGV